jgi:hypothetical protein
MLEARKPPPVPALLAAKGCVQSAWQQKSFQMYLYVFKGTMRSSTAKSNGHLLRPVERALAHTGALLAFKAPSPGPGHNAGLGTPCLASLRQLPEGHI